MIIPFISLTHTYNDDNTLAKHERKVWLQPDMIEYFASFEVVYQGIIFVVKENDQEILKKIMDKLEEISTDSMLNGDSGE